MPSTNRRCIASFSTSQTSTSPTSPHPWAFSGWRSSSRPLGGRQLEGTRAKNVSILKSFFRWAYERNRITGDPMLTIKRPRRRQPDRRRQAHEPKAVDAIVRAQYHQRDRAALLLMAVLGLRKNEIRLLKIRDIDFRDRAVHLLQKGGDRVSHPFGPYPDLVGELEAHITLDARKADEYLLYPRWERTVRGERFVYREDKHRPLSPRGMHEWFAKRLEEAGVPHFPMHELRHTAGTEFHRATGDLKKTQMFMRHKSITPLRTPTCTSTARTSKRG